MLLPYPAMPATTPSSSRAVFGCEGEPKRSELSEAIGRAPMVKTSRRMPPTPLARPLQDARALGRQQLEEAARRLVRAVLGPHRGEDAQLDQVGVAAQRLLDAGVFVGREAVLGGDLGPDLRLPSGRLHQGGGL